MAKSYLLQFSNGSPTLYSGLNPTMVVFKTMDGTNVTAPGITQIPTNSGLYYFNYGPTTAMAFVVDGATTGLSSSERYITGQLDPADAINEQCAQGFSNAAIGLTMQAIGLSLMVGISNLSSGITVIVPGISGIADLIGNTASSFGSTSSDPATIFGYLKRLQEWNEGNSEFNKSTSLWDVFSRGSSTLLAEKTLLDSAGIVSKT